MGDWTPGSVGVGDGSEVGGLGGPVGPITNKLLAGLMLPSPNGILAQGRNYKKKKVKCKSEGH